MGLGRWEGGGLWAWVLRCNRAGRAGMTWKNSIVFLAPVLEKNGQLAGPVNSWQRWKQVGLP